MLKNKLGKELLFFDGAMGSMLHSKGIPTGVLPETYNLTHPEVIVDIHLDYLMAGADIITTNTLGAFSTKFDNLEEIVAAAVANARAAIQKSGLPNKYVALDMGSTGKLLQPLGESTLNEVYNIFKQTAILGEKNGVDLIIIETMIDIYEAKAALLAVKENTKLPVICSMTYDSAGKTLTGGSVATSVAVLEGLGADAIGINCGAGPDSVRILAEEILQYASVPILIQPNAGMPQIVDGETVFGLSAGDYAEEMAEIAGMGAWLLGGCCGTTPAHIRQMIDLCKNIIPPAVTEKEITMASSYSDVVVFGEKAVIVGERINPTGKKKFKKALVDMDMDYIANEAISQKENGAHILDVNTGLPEIDEKKAMLAAIYEVQKTVSLPLQIDTTNAEVMEAALRMYNGKAVINSANGERASMDRVFPLAKKYGGLVVCLCLDENGIPDKAEDRLKVAEKIVNTAAEYGIKKKDLLIDTLTLSAGAQQSEALEAVKAIRLVKEKLGVKSVLGVSNISFGLPERENINTAFFTMALDAGLSACIINPGSEKMMAAYYAYNVLKGYDKNGEVYIQKYAAAKGGQAEKPREINTTEEARLEAAIVNGIAESARTEAKKLVERLDTMEIINGIIVPALDKVGKTYETGRTFLPQLMASAEAAKAAFGIINIKIAESGKKEEAKGKIIIATVEGDIHDIGKNIVRALLENYGFDVIDLGKNVPVDTVVEAAVVNDIRLVGLSALMTTTVPNMERTIAELKKRLPYCLVMVGGAVLNQQYADMIKADFYGKDALASVHFANKVFEV